MQLRGLISAPASPAAGFVRSQDNRMETVPTSVASAASQSSLVPRAVGRRDVSRNAGFAPESARPRVRGTPRDADGDDGILDHS